MGVSGKLVEGSRQPIGFTALDTSTGHPDYTTATSASAVVHRNYGTDTTSIETWTLSILSSTTTSLRASYTPTASGAGSLSTAGEVLRVRMLVTFPGPSTKEHEAFVLAPVEAR